MQLSNENQLFKAASLGLAGNAAPPSRPNIPLEAQQSHLTIAKSRRLAGGRPTERPTMFAKFSPFRVWVSIQSKEGIGEKLGVL